MVNTELINEVIERKGLKLKYIANEIGITSSALRKKIDNKSEFKVSEAYKFCEILGVDGIKLKKEFFLIS